MKRSIVTFYMLVDNEFGVLTRITAMLRREGFNIKSLAVEVTDIPEISQMLISVECLESAVSRVLIRLNKLGCVKKALKACGDFDLSAHLKNVFLDLKNTEKEGKSND
jgi:acetolactate synthase-1/3 small subunit